jgi:hypothetical protein
MQEHAPLLWPEPNTYYSLPVITQHKLPFLFIHVNRPLLAIGETTAPDARGSVNFRKHGMVLFRRGSCILLLPSAVDDEVGRFLRRFQIHAPLHLG